MQISYKTHPEERTREHTPACEGSTTSVSELGKDNETEDLAGHAAHQHQCQGPR